MSRGRVKEWRPQKGERFNAYVKRYDKLHAGGPFTRIDNGGPDAYIIKAINVKEDINDPETERVSLSLEFFWFEPT